MQVKPQEASGAKATTRGGFDSRTADKFVLRMPDGLRARIATQAGEHSRSMNAEIIHRLERGIRSAEIITVQNQLITQLSKQIEQLRRDLELATLRGDVAVEDANDAERRLAELTGKRVRR